MREGGKQVLYNGTTTSFCTCRILCLLVLKLLFKTFADHAIYSAAYLVSWYSDDRGNRLVGELGNGGVLFPSLYQEILSNLDGVDCEIPRIFLVSDIRGGIFSFEYKLPVLPQIVIIPHPIYPFSAVRQKTRGIISLSTTIYTCKTKSSKWFHPERRLLCLTWEGPV